MIIIIHESGDEHRVIQDESLLILYSYESFKMCSTLINSNQLLSTRIENVNDQFTVNVAE